MGFIFPSVKQALCFITPQGIQEDKTLTIFQQLRFKAGRNFFIKNTSELGERTYLLPPSAHDRGISSGLVRVTPGPIYSTKKRPEPFEETDTSTSFFGLLPKTGKGHPKACLSLEISGDGHSFCAPLTNSTVELMGEGQKSFPLNKQGS